jgi:hypothetical protein
LYRYTAGAAPVPALAVGACTAQVGELSLALLNRAHVLGIVSKKFYRPLLSVAVMVGMALFTLFCSRTPVDDNRDGPCNQADTRE